MSQARHVTSEVSSQSNERRTDQTTDQNPPAKYHSVVSHASAARLMKLGGEFVAAPIHVTVDARRHQSRLSKILVEDATHLFFPIRVHRHDGSVDPTVTVDGLRCVDAARVLIDVAPLVSAESLEAAFERARVLGLVSLESLARRFALLCGRGRPGTIKVRQLLAGARPGALDSRLEVQAARMLRGSRLAEPTRQLRVVAGANRNFRLDFAWPQWGVALETEGFEWHGSRAQWKHDHRRTAALERAGWRIVVATWDDIVQSPSETVERLAAAIAERRALVSSRSSVG